MRFAWTPLLLTVINSGHSTENQAKLEEDGGSTEDVFLVYSEPKLVRRHSRDDLPDDNIAMDSQNVPFRKLKVN